MTTSTIQTQDSKAVATVKAAPPVSVEEAIERVTSTYGSVTDVVANYAGLDEYVTQTRKGLVSWVMVAHEAKVQGWTTTRFAEVTGSSRMMLGRLDAAARVHLASKASKAVDTISAEAAYKLANGHSVGDVNGMVRDIESGKVPAALTSKPESRRVAKADGVSSDDKKVKASAGITPEHYATALELISANLNKVTTTQSRARILASARAIVAELTAGVAPVPAPPKVAKASRTSGEAHDGAIAAVNARLAG